MELDDYRVQVEDKDLYRLLFERAMLPLEKRREMQALSQHLGMRDRWVYEQHHAENSTLPLDPALELLDISSQPLSLLPEISPEDIEFYEDAGKVRMKTTQPIRDTLKVLEAGDIAEQTDVSAKSVREYRSVGRTKGITPEFWNTYREILETRAEDSDWKRIRFNLLDANKYMHGDRELENALVEEDLFPGQLRQFSELVEVDMDYKSLFNQDISYRLNNCLPQDPSRRQLINTVNVADSVHSIKEEEKNYRIIGNMEPVLDGLIKRMENGSRHVNPANLQNVNVDIEEQVLGEVLNAFQKYFDILEKANNSTYRVAEDIENLYPVRGVMRYFDENDIGGEVGPS